MQVLAHVSPRRNKEVASPASHRDAIDKQVTLNQKSEVKGDVWRKALEELDIKTWMNCPRGLKGNVFFELIKPTRAAKI